MNGIWGEVGFCSRTSFPHEVLSLPRYVARSTGSRATGSFTEPLYGGTMGSPVEISCDDGFLAPSAILVDCCRF